MQLRCYFRNQENPDKIDIVGGPWPGVYNIDEIDN